MNLGDTLNSIVFENKADLFRQGELAQLTYLAFDITVREVESSKDEEFKMSIPVGYRADKTTIDHERKYTKEALIEKYQHLAFHQLSINAVVKLVTIVETMLGDILRAVIVKYPLKLGGKRTISIESVLEATSIEEVHAKATDNFLNDLSYKSPIEYNECWKQLVSISLMECPAFHKYLEIKATRDIYIHNRGIANEVYLKKSGSHARVTNKEQLPVDNQYFLESYESCLKIADWLENQLHSIWHSSAYEERRSERKDDKPVQIETEAEQVKISKKVPAKKKA